MEDSLRNLGGTHDWCIMPYISVFQSKSVRNGLLVFGGCFVCNSGVFNLKNRELLFYYTFSVGLHFRHSLLTRGVGHKPNFFWADIQELVWMVEGVADGRCPPVPEVENAVASSTLAIQGTHINYQCLPGHLLPDRSEEYTIYCDGQNWNYTSTSCTGKEWYRKTNKILINRKQLGSVHDMDASIQWEMCDCNKSSSIRRSIIRFPTNTTLLLYSSGCETHNTFRT